MSALNTKQKIDQYIKENCTGQFNQTNFGMMYRLGKLIESNVPEIVDKRKQGGFNSTIEFKYVSWKWYEYILKQLDNNFWWEINKWSDNYQIVEVKIYWNNKEYKACYAVENSATKKDTREPLNNLGEMVVNEGMRCFAKLASRLTGLFFHLWLEGKND